MLPALRRLPNATLMVGDMIAGAKRRMAKGKAAGKTGEDVTPRAPAVPAAAAGGGRPIPVRPQQRQAKEQPDADRFITGGGTRDALIAEMQHIAPG